VAGRDPGRRPGLEHHPDVARTGAGHPAARPA
jgi:hypothetical protein